MKGVREDVAAEAGGPPEVFRMMLRAFAALLVVAGSMAGVAYAHSGSTSCDGGDDYAYHTAVHPDPEGDPSPNSLYVVFVQADATKSEKWQDEDDVNPLSLWKEANAVDDLQVTDRVCKYLDDGHIVDDDGDGVTVKRDQLLASPTS